MRISSLFLVLMLAACAPRVQDFAPSADTPAHVSSDVFYTEDGTELPYRSWLPKGKPKAVIVALHGFNDYSRAFEGTGDFFKSHGVAVFAYDQRGFGASPYTGVWGGEENFTSDLKRYVEVLAKRYPHTPVYVLGESMGGAVAISALADPAFPKVKGLILVAPAVWGEGTMNPIYRGTLWMAAYTFPYVTFTGSGLKIQATNNIPLLRRMSLDPLVLKHTRIDAIYGMVSLMDSAYDHVSFIHTPTLMLYGGRDQVIPKQPVESARDHFSIPITYAYYPNSYHMMLRDLQGEGVMLDILSWIRHPATPLPSGYGQAHEPVDNHL